MIVSSISWMHHLLIKPGPVNQRIIDYPVKSVILFNHQLSLITETSSVIHHLIIASSLRCISLMLYCAVHLRCDDEHRRVCIFDASFIKAQHSKGCAVHLLCIFDASQRRCNIRFKALKALE